MSSTKLPHGLGLMMRWNLDKNIMVLKLFMWLKQPFLFFIHRPQEVVIFIVGGTTYEESRSVALQNSTNSGIRFILGGSALLNSKRYALPCTPNIILILKLWQTKDKHNAFPIQPPWFSFKKSIFDVFGLTLAHLGPETCFHQLQNGCYSSLSPSYVKLVRKFLWSCAFSWLKSCV